MAQNLKIGGSGDSLTPSTRLLSQRLGTLRVLESDTIRERIDISADMALRLSDLLGTSAALWLGLQSAYDLWHAAQQPRPLVRRMVLAA